MSQPTPRTIIRETILGAEKPFNLADLYYMLETRHNITDRQLAMDIMDELCESGVVKFQEIEKDVWAFAVARNTDRYAGKAVNMHYEKTYLCPPDCGGEEFDEWGYVPYCPDCGKKLNEETPRDNFCSQCGRKLIWPKEKTES